MSTPPSGHEPVELDDVDRQILRLLHDDARMSIRALGRSVGMSPGAIGERLERLERRGVIRGFRVDVDPAALGLGLEVMVGLQLSQGTPLNETLELLMAQPEVQSVYLVTGHLDMLVHLRVSDQYQLRDAVLEGVWNIPDFKHAESMVILESHHRSAFVLPEKPGP